MGNDFTPLGLDLFGCPIEAEGAGKMVKAFVVPPFSVLDARQGYWQERKRGWLALGIKSELGRGVENLNGAHPETTSTINFYSEKRRLEKDLGRELTKDEAAEMLDAAGVPQNARGVNAERLAARAEEGSDYSKTGAVQPTGQGGLAAGHEARREREKAARAEVFGTGGPGTLDEQRKAWKEQGGLLGFSEQATSPGLNGYRDAEKARHTASLKGGLTIGTTTDPYRVGRQDAEPSPAESGTSIFDPVLCELAYRWFCPPTGHVLDPFAGGSVRGIIAAKLGRSYTGVDLRPEQVAANEAQARIITPELLPRWVAGDSRTVTFLAPGLYDFLFSCPPYFDLEVYSDSPADLSNAQDYPAFLADYRGIIADALSLLLPDRFACFVVGDLRDKKGFYRNFVSDTIAAFQDAGARLYNEAVLITQVGSLPIRVGKQFEGYRKLGKTHQNCLVFVKGCPRKASLACGKLREDAP